MKTIIPSIAVAIAMVAVPMFGRTNPAPTGDLADQVRHQLVMLP